MPLWNVLQCFDAVGRRSSGKLDWPYTYMIVVIFRHKILRPQNFSFMSSHNWRQNNVINHLCIWYLYLVFVAAATNISCGLTWVSFEGVGSALSDKTQLRASLKHCKCIGEAQYSYFVIRYQIDCILYTAFCILHTVYWILYTAYFVLIIILAQLLLTIVEDLQTSAAAVLYFAPSLTIRIAY